MVAVKSFILFFIFIVSFFFITERNTPLYKKQPVCKVSSSKNYTQEKQVSKNRTVTLAFDVKKYNHAQKKCKSGFCKKTSRSIFDDMIVRNVDTTLHFKFFAQRLHYFEYKKDGVKNNLFSCIASICDKYIHPADYYVYTLRKILT